MPNTKATDQSKDPESQLSVSFLSLFKYSSLWDKVLIVVATIFAVLFGALWPGILILFGSQADSFVRHAISENLSNSSLSNVTMSDADLMEEMTILCIYNATLGLLVFIFDYIIVTAFSLTAANQSYKIQCLFMSSILKQDISWFDTHQAGDFASRLTGDLCKIQDGIGDKFGICISFLSTSVLCAACGIYYGWKLALVTLSITPILSGAMAILSKVQVAFSAEESKAYAAAGTVAEEVLSSIRTVMAFGGEENEIRRYEKCLLPARKKGIKRGLMTSLGSALTWSSIFAGYAISFWYGVTLIVDGMGEENPEYTAGTLLTVFASILTSSMFIGQTAPYFEAFSLARGAAGKIFSIIERKPYIDSSAKLGEKPTELQGKITVKDIHFKYPARQDVPVLNGISLEVNPGQTVALVGSSGCGKSTIVQLVLRFYDPEKGHIEIDGNDVRNLNVGWLRNNIGFVGQEPVLFSTTIAENIRYGKSKATLAEIVNAAKLANVHDFIDSLPLKYETLVGDRGTLLSGGQKQRIAVARALVKNPKILLLDEATSALDAESEKIVQASLDQASEGRTTIIIAHRLSTIRNADKIFVLSDGEVKEIGNHDELMEKKGLYYQLVLNQMNEKGDGDDVNENEIIQTSPSLLRTISHTSNGSSLDFINPHKTICSDPEAKIVHYVFKDDKKEDREFSWTELFRLSYSEWPYMVTGGLSSLIMGLHTPVYGIIFGGILGALSAGKDQILEQTFFYCMIFLLLGGTSFIFGFLQISMFSIATEKLTNKLRKMVFSKIITQDLAWFDLPENSVGSLCSKLTSDASDMQGATGSRISTILQSLSTFVACIVIALYFNFKIGLLVFAFVPFIVISTCLEGRMAIGQAINDKPSTEMASKVATEAIDGIRTVASLHQEEAFCIQFQNALLGPFKNSRKKAYLRGFVFGFSQSIQSFAYSTAFYYGGTLVAAGEIGYPDLFKVLESVIISTAMLGQTVAFSPDYQKAKLAAARILKLLDLKGRIDVFSKQGKILEDVKGNLTFNQVRFNYPSRPDVKVLQGLNLEINSGKTIALVGSSGSGKSTCVQLIERFYDSNHGEILLDEIDVKDLNVVNLRSHIGLVSQEPILFSCSIAENIAYGRNSENIDMNDVITAAKQANIHTFISALPQGYDTPVGSKGTQLSGGQKQRVAIARALLRNPKILLLDEATSALDSESERIVQEALDNARAGRTCLIIAHRLSTVQTADSIVVLHKGKVVEQGKHQDLLKQKGHYYKLYNNQYSS